MRKIHCAFILKVIFVVAVSGRSLDEVLGTMDRQIGLVRKQLSSQIPDLSEPFQNWFLPTAEAQQNIQIPNQKTQNDIESSLSYQGNNAPPSWMTQNQNNNIPSWMINPPQNQRPTTQRPQWNQNVNPQPTQRPNPPQNNQQPQNPVQQQFTVPPNQNNQPPMINHQTPAPVVQTTVPNWLYPTNQPNLNNQQNLNNQPGLVNQPGQSNQPGSSNIPNINQPGQNLPNQPNLNNQNYPNQQIPVTQTPIIGTSQLPQSQAPNHMMTAPVIQNTQPVQVTNPAQPQFTAPNLQSTTPSNLLQQPSTPTIIQNTVPSGINQQTQAPIQHITAPVIQNTQSPNLQQTQAPERVIDRNTQPSWNREQTQAPQWLIPTQQPILLPEIPTATSQPMFTALVFSRTQQPQVMPSTPSPWMRIGPQITNSPNNQFPTAPSFTNFPRFPTAPSITMIPQFPSLNIIDSQQPWLNQQQNNQNLLEIEPQPWEVHQATNSQGVTFLAFTAPVIRKTQPPMNMRQNHMPAQNLQFTVPVITRSTTTSFPRVPIITRPTATTSRPIGPIFPIIPTTTTGRPTFPINIGQTTTTRNPIFPIIPQTTRQPQVTFFPPAVTTRAPNVLQTTTRSPLFPVIPQATTRPPIATTRPAVPTIRTTPRSPQAITRPPVVTTRATTTQRPQKQTTKEIPRTTPTPEIRQPPRNQPSINDIMKLTDNMMSSLNNQIWQSISRIG